MKSILLLLFGGWLALLSAFALLLALGGLFLVAWCLSTWVFVVFCCVDEYGFFLFRQVWKQVRMVIPFLENKLGDHPKKEVYAITARFPG